MGEQKLDLCKTLTAIGKYDNSIRELMNNQNYGKVVEVINIIVENWIKVIIYCFRTVLYPGDTHSYTVKDIKDLISDRDFETLSNLIKSNMDMQVEVTFSIDNNDVETARITCEKMIAKYIDIVGVCSGIVNTCIFNNLRTQVFRNMRNF